MIFNESPTKDNVDWENISFWVALSTPISVLEATRMVDSVKSRTDISPFDLYVAVRMFYNKEESQVNNLTGLIMQIWSLSSWHTARTIGVDTKKRKNPPPIKKGVSSHRLGEDCDICDGSGRDYLGKKCRKLVD